MKNHMIRGLLIAIIFLCESAQAVIPTIVIDTRFESAVPSQQNQAFVFSDQQELEHPDAFYGDVEFVNGISVRGNNQRTDLTLGINKPLGGTIRFTGGDGTPQHTLIQVVHDLRLTITAFELYPPNTSSSGTLAQLEFALIQDPNDTMPNPPPILSIERNLTATGDMIFSSDYGGIINGNNNLFTVPASEFLGPLTSSLFFAAEAPGGLTIKNTKFIIEKNGLLVLSGGSNFGAPTTLENVSILSFPASDAFIVPFSATPNFIYRGDNVIGDGSVVQFLSFPVQSKFKIDIDRESKLSVLPNTTLNLTDYNLGGTTFGFYFKDSTSQLYLDNCTLSIGGPDFPFPGARSHGITHMTFTAGTMIVNGNVSIIAGVPEVFGPGGKGSSLQFGDGIDPKNNFNVIILPGSKLIIEDGMTFTNANV